MMARLDTLDAALIVPVEQCPLCNSHSRVIFENDPNDSDLIHILKCTDCGLVYMSGVARSSTTEALYLSYSSTRDRRDPVMHRKRQLMYSQDFAFASRYVRETDRRVLDIGCGQGDFLAHFPEAIEKHGVEVDSEARAEATTNHPGMMLHSSLEAIPRDLVFDILIFRGTLQYMADLHDTIRFCDRVLSPGGRVILLATPNADSLLATIQKEYWVLCDKVQHRYWFGLTQIKRLFGHAFSVDGYDLPYLGTPYEDYDSDLAAVLRMLADREALREKVPFFGSMMNVALVKQPQPRE